jgi:hypothetical protein
MEDVFFRLTAADPATEKPATEKPATETEGTAA